LNPKKKNDKYDDKNDALSSHVISGTSWTYASRYGGKLINLIATAILARLLTQEDFGVAGYALVFIGFLEILEGFGVGQALVFSGDDEKSRNAAFKISLLMGVLLGVLTYLIAPLAGVIFNDPRAISVTEVLALVFPITALRTVHKSILQRKLQFARLAVPEFSKAGVKAIAAIGFAIFAFGPWSLIFAQIIGSAVETAVCWRVNRWRPNLRVRLDMPSIKKLLNYGGGIAGLQVLGAILLNLDYLLIGRYMGAAALGTYMIGFRVPSMLVRQFISTTSQIIFPVFVRMNENRDSLAKGWVMAMRYILMFTVPASLGLAAVADPFILAIFGERWHEAIPVVIAISIYSLIVSVEFNSGDVYKAQGRVSILVKLSLLQAAITIPALWTVAVNMNSIASIAWTHVVLALIMTTIRLVVASRVLAISLYKIGEAISRPLACGLIMFIAVICCNYLTTEYTPFLRLSLGIFCGSVVYVILSWFVLGDDIRSAITAIQQHRGKARPS